MTCAEEKLNIIKQFNDDPDKVWTDYETNNPGLSETHLKIYFDRACPKFCVTGPLAGNCRQTRRHDDNPQARST